MLITEHSVFTKASAQDVWQFCEPHVWPTWDDAIERASLDGSFALNTKGKLKPKNGPEVSFVVTHIEPLIRFSTTSYFPMSKLIFTHTFTPQAGRLMITHRIEMKGILAPLFAFLIGKKVKAGLPDAMQKLVKLAEEKSKKH